VDLDGNDDVFCSGYTAGDIFGSAIGGHDIILMKLSGLNGSLIFGTRLGTGSNDIPSFLQIHFGFLFITGFTFVVSFHIIFWL